MKFYRDPDMGSESDNFSKFSENDPKIGYFALIYDHLNGARVSQHMG